MLHMYLKRQFDAVFNFSFPVREKESKTLKCNICWVVNHGNLEQERLDLEFPDLASDFSFSTKCSFS